VSASFIATASAPSIPTQAGGVTATLSAVGCTTVDTNATRFVAATAVPANMVDLMRLFGGEFVEVQSIVANSHWGYDVEDNAYALMRTEDGVVGMLNSSATQWRHRFNLDINLERGSVIMGGLLTGTKSYGAETLTVVTVDHQSDNGDPREQITRYNQDPSWELEINHFVESILEGRPIENGTSLDAFNTMKLVYQIYYADPVWRKKFSIADPNRVAQ
jgi:predicted dehydrogenase